MLYLLGCTSECHFWDGLISRNDSYRDFSQFLKGEGMADFAVLATCHRWECYWYDEDHCRVEHFKEIIKERLLGDYHGNSPELTFKMGPAVVNHLFRVSSGLDSLIIGEHEILGQVRDCLKEAMELKTAGPVIGALLREAIGIGKKARNLTAIGRGKVSYASLISELIEKNNWQEPLTEVMIVGSGNLANEIAELLFKKGIKPFFIAGRDLGKANELALRYHGESAPLEQLPRLLNQFSIIIGASKANQILIKNEDLATISRRQMVIDLSVPGIVGAEIHQYKNIEYIGLNIIECMLKENLQQRQAEIEGVEFLLAGAVEEMVVTLRQRQRQEQIGASQEWLYQQGQSALSKVLVAIQDERIKQVIAKQWNDQLRKMLYLALSAEKNEKLLLSRTAENNFFPLILSLINRKLLVIGGGKVAARRVKKLLAAQAEITVIAPELEPELMELFKQAKLHWQKSHFNPRQLPGFDLVIAATDDHQVNEEIVKAARKEKILVNSVDGTVASDFLFPAVIRRGDLIIAISTAGKNPALAKKIRQELELLFGEEYLELLHDKEMKL